MAIDLSGIHLVVFDVDGTLTSTKSGDTFRQTADDWQWLDGRIEKCEQLHDANIHVAIAFNQAGVAFPWSRFGEAQMQREIEAVASRIGAGYIGVCYTTPNPKALLEYHNPNDSRRKLGPGMLLEAMLYCGVTAEETLMVGDRQEDEDAAKSAGVHYLSAEEFFKIE